jgi:hypothetical protein
VDAKVKRLNPCLPRGPDVYGRSLTFLGGSEEKFPYIKNCKSLAFSDVTIEYCLAG